jgi:GntR family transcriptional regulator
MSETQTTPMLVRSPAPADPSSPVPLYYQVETDLRHRIRSGELAPGDAVPPEHELCRIYGVSRHTVRTALSRLAAEKLIARGAGRGTFVLAQADRIRFYLDRSFTQQMADLGRRARSRVLEVEVGVVDATDPQPIRGDLGASCLRLARLRMGDDEPVGIQRTTVLTRRCPGLEDHDFGEESLYAVLAREHRLIVTEIHHTVGAAVAGPWQADLLSITEGAPLLIVSTTAYLGGREVLEHTASHYRADRYEYSTRHTV